MSKIHAKSCLLFLQLTQSSCFIKPAVSCLRSLCYNNIDDHKGTRVFHKQSRQKCNRLGPEKKYTGPILLPWSCALSPCSVFITLLDLFILVLSLGSNSMSTLYLYISRLPKSFQRPGGFTLVLLKHQAKRQLEKDTDPDRLKEAVRKRYRLKKGMDEHFFFRPQIVRQRWKTGKNRKRPQFGLCGDLPDHLLTSVYTCQQKTGTLLYTCMQTYTYAHVQKLSALLSQGFSW